jgi:uncharacterized protein YbjT (DUF2867 family)
MILVTGATGNVGRELVTQLIDRDVKVRAMSHDSDSQSVPDGAERMSGDPSQPELLAEALSGCDAMFLSVPLPELAREARIAGEVAQQVGVRRIVLNSSLSIELGHNHPLAKEHLAAEEEIVASGCEWVFLRSTSFFSNTVTFWARAIRSEGVVRTPFLNNPVAAIDPFDVAAVAVEALRDDDHVRQIYGLTGGEKITPEEQVAILSELLDKPIEFSVMTDQEAKEWFLARYADPAEAESKLHALRAPDRPYAWPRRAVQRITGREPRTFREWAERNLSAFQ